MNWSGLISTVRGVVGSNLPARRKDSPEVMNAIVREGSAVPVTVADALQNVVGKVHDYLVTAQQEQTKRADIARQRDIAIASIEAQRAAFSELLKYTFEERAMVLGKQFEALDQALASGNVEVVQASLNSMVAIIQTSPFRTVQEMQQALGSKDFVVRLE